MWAAPLVVTVDLEIPHRPSRTPHLPLEMHLVYIPHLPTTGAAAPGRYTISHHQAPQRQTEQRGWLSGSAEVWIAKARTLDICRSWLYILAYLCLGIRCMALRSRLHGSEAPCAYSRLPANRPKPPTRARPHPAMSSAETAARKYMVKHSQVAELLLTGD